MSSCDVRGTCTNGCDPGWMGTDCMEKCSDGQYGKACGKSCVQRNCLDSSSSCNHVTGNVLAVVTEDIDLWIVPSFVPMEPMATAVTRRVMIDTAVVIKTVTHYLALVLRDV
ncbi:uncharacterized protein LOC121368299 [Gigantopelta aegis]|uniref:uncharacterized protein LOC121368299 n=1 Tax=Gigantopelta aegis TaxID=1735272 RepID=UPI001B88D532|nr:uncharacterized protein LOC121368299 [Gigantopelta aegis]